MGLAGKPAYEPEMVKSFLCVNKHVLSVQGRWRNTRRVQCMVGQLNWAMAQYCGPQSLTHSDTLYRARVPQSHPSLGPTYTINEPLFFWYNQKCLLFQPVLCTGPWYRLATGPALLPPMPLLRLFGMVLFVVG